MVHHVASCCQVGRFVANLNAMPGCYALLCLAMPSDPLLGLQHPSLHRFRVLPVPGCGAAFLRHNGQRFEHLAIWDAVGPKTAENGRKKIAR